MTVMTGRRTAAMIAVVAFAVLGLTGCQQSNTPKAYDDVTQQNFLELCTNHYYDTTDGNLTMTSNTIAADVEAPSSSQCQCQYDAFSQQMSIADFTTLNDKLKTDPQAAWATVPDTIVNAINDCVNGFPASSTTSTTEGSTVTSAAPETTTSMP
ncbi:MAG: hypothetical protein KGR18_05160 [Acidobacteria bacterium]|nr:hypothetical protein [Acidobacteriota bacterium]